MQRALATLLLAGVLAAPASSDVLDKTRVPAGARAIVHVDVEALLASQLVRQLEQADPDLKIDFDLGEATPLLKGVRPLQDVRSVTVFGVDFVSQHERFGVVLRTSDKADALLKVAIATDSYELVPLAGWQVHSWKDADHRFYGAVVPMEGTGDRLVLMSNDPDLMGAGIAALDGSGKSLATRTEGQLAARPEPGAIVFAASDVSLVELTREDPTSSVARLVHGGVLQLGEVKGEVFANLALVTERPEDALRVQQVLQGVTALASLVSEEAEQGLALQRLVGALRFHTTASQLFAEFRYDLASLIRDLQVLEGSF